MAAERGTGQSPKPRMDEEPRVVEIPEAFKVPPQPSVLLSLEAREQIVGFLSRMRTASIQNTAGFDELIYLLVSLPPAE